MTYLLIAIATVWFLILTVVVFKLRKHYYNLVSSTRKERLDEILDTILKNQQQMKTEEESLKKKLDELIKNSAFHIQKIGLVRFNPFGTVGGEQSFVAAFMDTENNGIVLNFIYTKEGLRVYTKRVKKGVGVEYELSKEEEKAIEKSA